MLDDILASTRERIAQLATAPGPLTHPGGGAGDLTTALQAPGLGVIGEIKRRSPSRGELATRLDPVKQALLYQKAGAAAVSVLTEPHHFGGSNQDLTDVAQAVQIPVLRKDFIIDSAQVGESARIGADALLLIVAILSDQQLAELLSATEQTGLTALVEVHNAEEARRAISAGAKVVGVNNRDLRDFTVDLRTALRLAPLLTEAKASVAESGISTPAQAARMAQAGYDAVLVGEALVTASDPAGLVSAMSQSPR